MPKDHHKPDAEGYAHDLILLLGNRKLCRTIVAASPITAIAFFDEMTVKQKYAIPIGAFASNVSTEAILNKDSILYHEGDGYTSGLMGYRKDFSQAVYGNYGLVEGLAGDGRSPLDIPYEIVGSWDAKQWEVYGRVILITLKNYLNSGYWGQDSLALFRSLKEIEHSCIDVYKLSKVDQDYYLSDIFRRLQAAVRFVKEAVDLVGHQDPLPPTVLWKRDRKTFEFDLYDRIADLMFEIIFSASCVATPSDKCWLIHYNAVWGEFFGLTGGEKAWGIIHHKLRRLLFDEIVRLETMPNFKSSKILGFCLNVMGLVIRREDGISKESYALQKSVLAWTRTNYLKLKHVHPEVAESCLIGSISYDRKGSRIVKTYLQGLELESPKEYLELAPITQ